jgi:hypothetical protein
MVRKSIGAFLILACFDLMGETHAKTTQTPRMQSSAESSFSQVQARYTSTKATLPRVDELNIDQSLLPILECFRRTRSADRGGFKYEQFEGLLHQFKDVESNGGGQATVGPGLFVSVSDEGGALSKMKLLELGEFRKGHRDRHTVLHKKSTSNKRRDDSKISSIATLKNSASGTTNTDDDRADLVFENEVSANTTVPGAAQKTTYYIRRVPSDRGASFIVKIVESYQHDGKSLPGEDRVTYCQRPPTRQAAQRRRTQ